MALESGTYISDLNPSNPVGATDKVSTLDDHIRLIKATLQTTFPGIAGAVTATHTELNFLDGVTGTTGTGKLVLDATPTIAGLTVTGSITLPSASIADAALSSNIPRKDASNVFTHNGGIQASGTTPRISIFETDGGEDGKGWSVYASSGVLNISLTEDAQHPGLSNAVNGFRMMRNGMTVTEIEVNATEFEVNATTLDFNGNADISGTLAAGGLLTLAYGDPSIQLVETDADENEKAWWIRAQGGGLFIQGRVDGGSASGATNIVAITRATGATSAAEIELNAALVEVNGAVRAGTSATSTSTTLTPGQVHHVTGNVTINTAAAGNWVGIYNNSGSSITLTQGSGLTLRLAGTGLTGNRTLAARGLAVVYWPASSTAVVSGGGVS